MVAAEPIRFQAAMMPRDGRRHYYYVRRISAIVDKEEFSTRTRHIYNDAPQTAADLRRGSADARYIRPVAECQPPRTHGHVISRQSIISRARHRSVTFPAIAYNSI